MAIANKNDLSHIVRTTQQWTTSYDSYECIPEGVLCVEFTPDGHVKAKIGNGHDIFSKLPYIGGADLTNYYTKSETAKCVEEIIKANRFIRIKGILQNKDRLPSHAECGDLYFVISQNQSSSNKYDEYVYSPSNTWENLGSIPIDIDLSEYAKIVYVDEKIDEVNERIDDIEQHGTHTHANKDILDLITAAFTAEEKDKLSTLYNYDDSELRELITQASHTHSNKDILDAISAPFTKEDKSKLDQLNPYDDSILKEKIQALERLAHEHSNKRILDQTTASFTKEYERKMRWIRLYTGCTGMEEGIAGLVPAAQAGEEDYVLSGSGEWVPQTGGGGTYELPIATTSTLGGIKVGDGLEIDANGKLSVVGGGGGGDSIVEGDGITIITDPQTGVKTISVNTGDHLSVDSQTGELNVSGVMEEFNIGKGLELVLPTLDTLPAGYGHVDYVKTSGAAYAYLDYYVTVNTKVVGTATCDTFNNDAALFGTRQGSGNNEFVMWMQQKSTDPTNMITGFVYGANTWSTSTDANNGRTAPYHQGDQYDFEASVAGGLKINNQLLHNVTNYGNPSSTKLCVFACNGYSRGIYNGKMYQFKLYENDTLSAKLIPAVRLSDNAVGFYDVINDIFYTSSASTPFTTDMSTLIIDDPTKVLNAKIGNGLQFDSNDAIKVVTGNGLQINQDGELEIDPSIIPEVTEYEAGDGIEIAEVTHEDEFRVQNQEYFFTDHGLTCIITGNYGPRTFTKINDGDIVAAVIGATGGWYMPLFVGLTEDSVKYSNSYDSNILGPTGSFTYHDKTWYYTADYALTAGDGVDHAGHLQSMTDTIYTESSKIQAAKDLIDLAILLPDVSVPTISAKIGTGLSFDANGAIQADAQPLSPATDSTLGGVIVGEGLEIDNDGTISVDPTIIPEVTEYEAGTAISIENVEHGGVTFDAWDSGTGWENICYSNSTGNSITSYQYEAHSPISNSYTLPAGATRIRAIAYDQNDTMLWTSFSWIDSNDYHFASTSPDVFDDWFEIPTGAVKVNFGVRHSKLNNTTAMSLNDIKSVDITIQTVNEIEVDVWNSGTGWLNGDYGSGTSNDFYTNWYYTYHYNYQQYIEVPEGATHVMVKGISNENDSHFEGGGCNAFDSNHNHVYWWACAWEWQELSSDVKYIQPNVKWDDNNTRTISGSDIKSVTLVWKLPALEINQAINVKYGNGLTVNQNNELEVKLGDGLSIDEDGAIEVTGGGSGGDSIAEGDGIEITTDQQTGVKTIAVNVGNGLEIDPNTGALGVAPGVSGNYSAGEAIEFETVTDTHDIVWDMLQMSHTWVNKAYTAHVGGSFENDSLCVHSDITPISNLFSIPQNGTIYTIEARDQNDNLLHCIVDYHDGAGNHLGWNGEFISDPTKQYTSLSSAIYISVGVVNTDHSTPLAISNVKSVTFTWKNVTETSTEISVKYGTGLSVDPITNELFVDGQLPEGTIIKKLTYVGDGSTPNSNIHFSKKPLSILSLNGLVGQNYGSVISTPIDAPYLHGVWGGSTGSGASFRSSMSYDDTTNTLSIQNTSDVGLEFNISGVTYTMFYLTKGHTGSGTSVNNEVSVVKTFSYVGTGTSTNNVQFPETPDMLLSIYGPTSDGFIASSSVPITSTSIAGIYEYGNASRYGGVVSCGMSFNDSTNILTLSGGVDDGARFNISGATYIVTYSVNEVIPSTMSYDAGEAISIETIGGLQPTNYSNDDFVDSIVSMNAGSIVKAADKSSFTITASMNDCYTRGSSGQANGSYPFNVKASTKYRFAWDSADPTVHGKVYTYENGLYDVMMHEIDQYDSSYLEFTTSPNTTFIQARFGVMYAGDSITYSNVRLYEVIEDEDQYDEISVKHGNGLSVNQNNELEVNIGTGLAFDPQTGAINVTGGGGGSGDTVTEGGGIEITTDQQTGNKVIAVNAGTGLQVDQTTNELEIDDSVVTEDDELSLVFVPDDYQPS